MKEITDKNFKSNNSEVMSNKEKQQQIDEIAECVLGGTIDYRLEVAELIYNKDFRKQKEGEWKTIPHYKSDTFNAYSHICKVEGCGYFYKDFRPHGYKFCPNCGAKMRKEDEGK